MKAEVVSNEEDWSAECDARTLIDAEAIKVDSARLKKAQGAAKKMVKEKQDEATAAKKIASPKKELSLIEED